MSGTTHVDEQGEPCPPPNTDIHVYLPYDDPGPVAWPNDHDFTVHTDGDLTITGPLGAGQIAVFPKGGWRDDRGPLPIVESP